MDKDIIQVIVAAVLFLIIAASAQTSFQPTTVTIDKKGVLASRK